MVHPIKDKYYNANPYYKRNSGFVASKGLVSDEKGQTSDQSTPSTPDVTNDEVKGYLAPSKLHETVSKSLSPKEDLKNYLMPSQLANSISQQTTLIRPPRSPVQNSNPNSQKENLVSSTLQDLTSRLAAVKPVSRQQEQGNTKKKRSSRLVRPAQSSRSVSGSSADDRAYGDPAKIRQFFPELTL